MPRLISLTMPMVSFALGCAMCIPSPSTDNMYSSHHKIANNTFHQQNDMADKTYLDYFKQVIYKQVT